ncbi:MAG: leucine-rich repeat protein [Lachnospiraceae bacterium]|nr:leucine-rich repeat protein [Lachnospiraceae bacterium]
MKKNFTQKMWLLGICMILFIFMGSTLHIHASQVKAEMAVTSISNANELKMIKENLGGNYKLVNDIVLTDAEWESLGKFEGTLDGAGYKISGLASSKGQGLFTNVSKTGIIKNLTLEGNIITESTTALLVMSINQGIIENCVIQGSIKQLTEDNSTIHIAGFVQSNYGMIKGCVNEAELYRESTLSFKSHSISGITALNMGTVDNCINEGKIHGIAGSMVGIVGTNNYIITNCLNTANIVNAPNEEIYYGTASAGIAGSSVGIISNCINQGDVTTYGREDMYENNENGGTSLRWGAGDAAGIVVSVSGEHSKGAVVGCTNKGRIQGFNYAAGICAQVNQGSTGMLDEEELYKYHARGLIANCNNEGEIVAKSSAGGIVGEAINEPYILKCINNGKIIAKFAAGIVERITPEMWLNDELVSGYKAVIEDCINNGKIGDGSGWAAGIVHSIYAHEDNPAVVRRCTNNGEILAKEYEAYEYYYKQASGVANTIKNTIVEECVNTGTIEGAGAAGLVEDATDSSFVNCLNRGKIIGHYAKGLGSASSNNEYIGCCSTGCVEGEEKDALVMPRSDEDIAVTVNNCYYTKQAGESTIGLGCYVDEESSGNIDAYKGLDFTNVWTIKEIDGVNTPVLQEKELEMPDSCLENTDIKVTGETYDIKAASGELFLIELEKYGDMGGVDLYNKYYANMPGKVKFYAVFMDGKVQTGEISVYKDINEADFIFPDTIKGYVYNGQAREPSGSVYLSDDKGGVLYNLKKEIDYTVTYANNINAGTASVIITGKGYWTGSITKEFTIKGVPIEEAAIILPKESYVYKGEPIRPNVTVRYKGNEYKENVDYTVTYTNNDKIGTATVTVTGIGSCYGSATEKFTIKIKKGTEYTLGDYKYKILNNQEVVCIGLHNTKLTQVNIPKSIKLGGKNFYVEAIEKKAFYKNKSIKTVTLGYSIESIGESAFEGCTNLSKVKMDENVKQIGKKAFKGCKKLKSIVIPLENRSIGQEAFRNCTKLKTIHVDAYNLKKIGKNAFKNIKSKAKIKVYYLQYEKYKKLFKGKGQSKKTKFVKFL